MKYREWLMGKYLAYGERPWVNNAYDSPNVLIGGDRANDVKWNEIGWYITKAGIEYLKE